MDKIRDLISEMADSLPDLIDVATGLEGDGKSNVLEGLNLLYSQVKQLDELTKDK